MAQPPPSAPPNVTGQQWTEFLALIVREFQLQSARLLTAESKFFGGLDDGEGPIDCKADDVVLVVQAVEEQWAVQLRIAPSLPLVNYTLGTVYDALIEALSSPPQ